MSGDTENPQLAQPLPLSFYGTISQRNLHLYDQVQNHLLTSYGTYYALMKYMRAKYRKLLTIKIKYNFWKGCNEVRWTLRKHKTRKEMSMFKTSPFDFHQNKLYVCGKMIGSFQELPAFCRQFYNQINNHSSCKAC